MDFHGLAIFFAAPSGVTNLPSETFLRCVDNCPTTSEYNPVCGSDMQSYHNMAKFGCAVSCGARIRVIRVGTCLPVNG
uniref:Kazal-like domain-containing protein n=2 Tax=Lutzomyia longipalpis TaxID=7200 RepID=A0A1B0CK96_LUTLO